ncbi:MAG: hypothetical protein WAT39_05900 [Planctomycetota bacterium]
MSQAAAAFVSLLAMTGLAAQTASGVVHGLAGEPADRAHVRGLDAARQTVAEGASDDVGRFELKARAPIAWLQVRIEGVLREVPVTGGAAAGLVVSLADTPHATIRGELRDPGGALATGVDVLCRDRQQHAIATVTTDERGTFALRTNQDVHDAVVDPVGWRHVVPGPFGAESPIAIDLRTHAAKFFRLHGNTIDDRGRPATGWRVTARDETGRVATTTTGEDGSYALWCNRPVTMVEASLGPPRLGRLGPWQATTELALDEREHALVLVSGRFVDRDGKGLANALVIATLRKEPPKKGVPVLCGTDRDGRFVARLVRGTPFLFAVSKDEKHQALVAVPFDGQPLLVRAQ